MFRVTTVLYACRERSATTLLWSLWRFIVTKTATFLFHPPGEESTCVVDTRSPFSLQLIFRHLNTHKFHQYNQYAKLKNDSVGRCVTIFSEDREIIASSARSNERRQAPGPSVNFKDETNINGDLKNESQKTQAERLKTQPEN